MGEDKARAGGSGLVNSSRQRSDPANVFGININITGRPSIVLIARKIMPDQPLCSSPCVSEKFGCSRSDTGGAPASDVHIPGS